MLLTIRFHLGNMPKYLHYSGDCKLSRLPSPYRHSSHESKRFRSRSPPTSHRRHEDHRQSLNEPISLPFNAYHISKHDLSYFRPVFVLYLDIQKQFMIEDLSEDEVRGRWKSFVNKWYVCLNLYHSETRKPCRRWRLTRVRNRGELAEGWYDPRTV